MSLRYPILLDVSGRTNGTSPKTGICGYCSGSSTGVRAASASGYALVVDGKNYFKCA